MIYYRYLKNYIDDADPVEWMKLTDYYDWEVFERNFHYDIADNDQTVQYKINNVVYTNPTPITPNFKENYIKAHCWMLLNAQY